MKTLFFTLLIAASTNVFSQAPPNPPTPPSPPDPPKKGKVESMRIGFITQKLDLTPEEAQKFWPVYNEFQKKREEFRKKKHGDGKKTKQALDSLSDKEIEKLVDDEIASRQKELDLQKEYHSKFKSVLPIKKVAQLYRAEEQFAHHLLNQLSENKKKGHSGGGGKKKGMAPPLVPPMQDE